MRLVAVLTCAALILPATASAQAGSTGGTIGKTDKSISGGGERRSPTPDVSARRPTSRNSSKEDSFPKTIQLNEHANGQNYSITLRNVGGNNYRGTWSHGYVTRFTVTAFTRDSMTIPHLARLPAVTLDRGPAIARLAKQPLQTW
jgi:hypothetical protein